MTATASEKPKTDTLHGPNLILDVENFGPIAEAKNIEFKPMTVLVGPSNTGKTYLAMLLHALLRARSESSALQSNISPIRELDFAGIEKDSMQEFVTDIQSIVRKLPPSTRADVYDSTLWIAVDDLSLSTRRLLEKYARYSVKLTAARYQKLIHEYFEIDSIEQLSNFSPEDQHKTTILCGETTGHWQLSNRLSVECDITGTYFGVGGSFENMLRHYSLDGYLELREEALKSLVDFSVSVSNAFVQSYYFPAERSGILSSRHVLAQQLTARDHKYNRLSRDFLSAIVGIRQQFSKPVLPERRVGFFRNQLGTNVKVLLIAKLIEDSVLRGKVMVDDTASLPAIYFIQHNNIGGRVPVETASSMVSDLAPIVLFLRNYILLGDLLIIDEPEAHLHPAAQQQMAAALAFMVRSGLRVLITTHSHYMVEQLSAFVNASKLDETTRKRALSLGGALGEEDIYLNEDETAVYSFKMSPEHGGSVVEEIFMGEEFEYGSDDHSDATTDQFNRLQRVLEAREKVEFGELD